VRRYLRHAESLRPGFESRSGRIIENRFVSLIGLCEDYAVLNGEMGSNPKLKNGFEICSELVVKSYISQQYDWMFILWYWTIWVDRFEAR